MNGLGDALTIGIVITLVFGALFFYLYSRLAQNEKRVSLIENILLDLKMSADAGWGVGGSGSGSGGDNGSDQHGYGAEPMNEYNDSVNHVEPISSPEPLASDDVDENMYKDILAQTSVITDKDEIKSFDVTSSAKSSAVKTTVQVTKVQANYEAMSNKELKTLAKQRGLNIAAQAGKKEIISTLRKSDGVQPSEAVEAGSFLGTQEGAPLEGDILEDADTL